MIIPSVHKTLKGYFKEHCISNNVCARDVGFSAAYIGRVLNGKASIGTSLARSLSDKYGFSYGWLMSGEGNIFSDDPVHEISLKEEYFELNQRLIALEEDIKNLSSRQTNVKQ